MKPSRDNSFKDILDSKNGENEKVQLTPAETIGTIIEVTISKDDTVILDGASQKKSIEERCEQIKSTIELSTSNYDKEKLQERPAKISGGVAKMHV
ncbi:Chaperonin CPN60-1, mitochondrial [Capsicum baccatum]|uniref:Chaperonin CPN60-1, mitochondrial n=1 Tax=Capsicum baccatum TaxID=33114 RepID=A0A2G2VM97_CAPBA|nr:Chaperonin CPN60-1, mitochondrial [Capsicum baccatum]